MRDHLFVITHVVLPPKTILKWNLMISQTDIESRAVCSRTTGLLRMSIPELYIACEMLLVR